MTDFYGSVENWSDSVFKLVSKEWFTNGYLNDGEYEYTADSRKHDIIVNDLFWAHITVSNE